MEKKDLKSGMLVKLDKRPELFSILICTGDGDLIAGFSDEKNTPHHYRELKYYNDDLTHMNNKIGDIVEVYSILGELLWKRKPKKQCWTIPSDDEIETRFKKDFGFGVLLLGDDQIIRMEALIDGAKILSLQIRSGEFSDKKKS